MSTAALEVDLGAPVLGVLGRALARLEPPPSLTVSEFCDRELIVTTGPLAGTHWQTAFAPYQRGILDAYSEPGVEYVIVRGSSQFGKTSMAVGLVCYHVAHDPCPILIVEPTVDPMARDFARNRLEPIIESSPLLRETVSKKRAKDAQNTTLAKSYRGGSLSVGGANSAASLAARSIRLLVLDEVDRYPAELPGEGSTIQVAVKRTTSYRSRRRVMMLSTPTLVGAPIDSWFHRGDERRFFVPCPKCGEFHTFEWRNMKWTKDNPSSARLECPECGYRMDDTERLAILTAGEWRPTKPDRPEKQIVSFHIWEAYSPFSSLEEIVAGFLAARKAQKAGDRSVMHTWQNTTLGEPIEPDAGEGVEPHVLLMRREQYPCPVPEPAVCLTMGVDVQDDRLEALVVGWGLGEESWLVDRQTLPGDTSQPAPWLQLEELLGFEYHHATDQRIPIQSTCIDSAGHRTTLVYDFAARLAARRVYATIGRDGQRPIVSSPSPRKWGRDQRNVPLYTVGVDAAKALVLSRLAVTEKGAGYFHIPVADWADEELAAQLTSERLVTKWKQGVPSQHWRKVRARNEGLDCAVLALAALRLLHPDLERLAKRLASPTRAEPKPRKPAGWLGPGRKGWLK